MTHQPSPNPRPTGLHGDFLSTSVSMRFIDWAELDVFLRAHDTNLKSYITRALLRDCQDFFKKFPELHPSNNTRKPDDLANFPEYYANSAENPNA